MKADVAAPGVAILSTMPTYPVTLTTSYGYRTNYDAFERHLDGDADGSRYRWARAFPRIPVSPPRKWPGSSWLPLATAFSWNPNLAFGVVNAYKAVSSAIHSDYVAPAVNLISPAKAQPYQVWLRSGKLHRQHDSASCGLRSERHAVHASTDRRVDKYRHG